MDWHTFNGSASLLVSIILARIVLCPNIEEGMVVKVGLITMVFSMLGTAYHMFTKSEDVEALIRAGASLCAGIFLVIVGVFLKTRSGKPWSNEIFGERNGPA